MPGLHFDRFIGRSSQEFRQEARIPSALTRCPAPLLKTLWCNLDAVSDRRCPADGKPRAPLPLLG